MQAPMHRLASIVTIFLGATGALGAGETVYNTRVVASGLSRPTGIVAAGNGTLYFTEIPVPGVGGGANAVRRFSIGSGKTRLIHQGEPEPRNLAIGEDGELYWTCTSAGVILERDAEGNVGPFLTGLERPVGIAADRHGEVYFTQVPTPGISGSQGGRNTVNVSDGASVETLTLGEPEPTDIVVSRDGDLYWTCRSAGVILHRSPSGAVSLVRAGLDQPTGIALDVQGRTLFFTEVPTPGVPGSRGGSNRVQRLDLETGELETVDFGDPEPTDITVTPNGTLYWTCTSAGVIVEATPVRP